MVEANIKIIEELKLFLECVSKDPDLRKIFSTCDADFSRTRKLPMERIVGIIINMPKRSLSIEIADFFSHLNDDVKSCTKGAFSLQRSKLKPEFFDIWNQWIVNCFYHYYGDDVKRWRGFILQAVDGSTCYLLNNDEIIDYFGAHKHPGGAIAMGRILQLYDVLNKTTIWGQLCPIKVSESALMASKVSGLRSDSLTIFDRGFASYGLMYQMINEETPRHFIIRCKLTHNKEVEAFARSGKTSRIIELRPGYKAIQMLKSNGYMVTCDTPIRIRMVKFNLPNGEKEILLTNLLDEKCYKVETLKEVYSLRWGIETSYGKQKNQQQMEQFSGHRVICIMQDFAASILIANLQSLIEKQCKNKLTQINARRKLNYQINCNLSWAALKHNVVKLFLGFETEEILLHLQLAFERNIEPVRPGRKYPRLTKARRISGKYQTFTNYKRAI